MKSKKNKKDKLEKVKSICEEECNTLYLEKDIDVAYHHYSDETQTVFLRENPKTMVRVTHSDVKHLEKRIRKEVDKRWLVGLLVSRPEMFSWYTGEDKE
jgi:hypothetical protein